MPVPWSTPELASMARTTVNTIRHYHRLGLLEEPERSFNGYREYQVRHLVRLLRIRRLAGLGVPLAHIAEVGADAASTPDLLRELDHDLAESIKREQRARADIAAILRDNAPADSPPGFERVASRMSEADSSLIHIYAQLLDDEIMADLLEMTESNSSELALAIDTLPADADETTRQALAERITPSMAQNFIDYPWLRDPLAHLKQNANITEQTFIEAVVNLYNPAQLDVFYRASVAAHALLRGSEEVGEPA
jgi:DNA-binding transcriptional MerR regulator